MAGGTTAARSPSTHSSVVRGGVCAQEGSKCRYVEVAPRLSLVAESVVDEARPLGNSYSQILGNLVAFFFFIFLSF